MGLEFQQKVLEEEEKNFIFSSSVGPVRHLRYNDMSEIPVPIFYFSK